MQYSEIKKAYELSNEFVFAKSPKEIDMAKVNLNIWYEELKNIPTEKAKVIFSKYPTNSTRELKQAIMAERVCDELFDAQMSGYKNVEEHKKATEVLRKRIQEKIDRMVQK